MDSESAINAADLLLRQVADAKIATSAPAKKSPIVKEELQFLNIDEVSQEKILDTLQFIHGDDFTLPDASAYKDENSNLGKKFWVGQGTLVVKGGCDFSKTRDEAVDEMDRLKHFALFRLESYGFHRNHSTEALEYCSGNIEDCLYLLYCKYFNLPYPFPHHNVDCTEEELMEQRADEKSSLESIYEKSFTEKVKNSVWILELKLDYLINLFRKKSVKVENKLPQHKVKKKEKCRLLIRGQCKYGDKCRFSHELEEVKKDINEIDSTFELEIRFPPNSKYPFEPPLIFLRKNDVVPALAKLQICKRLFEEAESYAKDGIPSIYTITELVQNSEEISEYLKREIIFLNPKSKLFDDRRVGISTKHKSTHYKRGMTSKDNKRVLTEQEISRENNNIVEKFRSKVDREDYKKMLSSRRNLPVWNYMNDILNTIESSQVSVKNEFY